MTAPPTNAPPDSGYLDYLPAVMRTAGDGGPGVLGQFLRAFEDVLTGRRDPDAPGLAEIIGGISGDRPTDPPRLAGLHRYAEPGPGLADQPRSRTPAEFLDWLARWVALSLRADLTEQQQREFIARTVTLYQMRGTRRGLEQVLSIYTGLGVTVSELDTGLCVGTTATIGKDTILQGGGPHFFQVTVRVPPPLPPLSQLAGYQRIAIDIIEAEKPAYCIYQLSIIAPSLQIGVTSRVGVDTLLEPTPASGTNDGTDQRRDQ